MTRADGIDADAAARCRGMTLVEVVASLAILGTVLVILVLAGAQHTRQAALAAQKQDAAAAAEELLGRWWLEPATLKRSASGAAGRWRWSTRVVPSRGVEEIAAEVVRVELRPGAAALTSEPTLTVDLMLPTRPERTDATTAPPTSLPVR